MRGGAYRGESAADAETARCSSPPRTRLEDHPYRADELWLPEHEEKLPGPEPGSDKGLSLEPKPGERWARNLGRRSGFQSLDQVGPKSSP